MRSRTVFALVALVLTGVMAAHGYAAEPDQFAAMKVATVNGDPVTIKDLRSQFKNRHGGHTKFLGGEEELRTFLRISIEDRLLLQEAYEIGLDSDPAVKAQSDAFEDNKAADYLVKVEVEDKSEPSKEEARAIWEKYGTFLVQIREIGVRTRIEAEEIRNGLLHGADPEMLARTCSLLMTRQRGGLRLAGWGGDDPEREAMILALEPGDVSPVLEIDGGFEVLVGEGRVDAIRPEFDKVSDSIMAILRKRKKEEREKAIASEVWTKYHAQVTLADPSLSAFRALLEATPQAPVATWDGGQLAARATASLEDLKLLDAMPAAEARAQLTARIRATTNSALFALEARARKLNEVPEIAYSVTDFREKLMLDALYGEHILKEFTLSDDEVRTYYDAHKTDFSQQERRRVAQILVGSEKEAKAIAAELAKGADFAQLAKTRSKDITTASAGGDLGWITSDHVPPTFADVFKLPAGKFTQPVRTAAGWHIIAVSEVQEKRLLSFAEAKDAAKNVVSEQKKRTMRDVWLKTLRDAAKIEIDDEAIRKYCAANPIDPNKPAPSMQHAMDGKPAGH
jgi:parvulin-like peptidyl-prolyl isomerase